MIREIYIKSNRPVQPIQWVYGTNGLQIGFDILDFDLATVSSVKFYSLTASGARYEATGAKNGSTVSFKPVSGFFAVGCNTLQCELVATSGTVYSFAVSVYCEENNKFEGAEQDPIALANYIEQINKNTEAITDLKERLPESGGSVAKEELSDELKQAWKNHLTEIAYKSPTHPYTDALIALLDGSAQPDTPTDPDEPDPPTPTRTLQSISATYTGGDVDAGTLATELTGIAVTGHYNVAPLTETVTGWTITGTVEEGTNTFTISYGGKTTTITVTGVASDEPVEDPWEESFTLSYAQSTAPASTNNYTPVKTTNTGYANACTDVSEHMGGVLYVDVTDETIGFEISVILEHEDGTRINSVRDISYPTEGQTITLSKGGGGGLNFIGTKNNPGISFKIKIPSDTKILLFFRNMTNKANVIGQNGVTFTLKNA